MMKTLLTLILCLTLSTVLSAQMYEKSIGVRLGYSNGIYFEKQNNAIESYRFMFGKRDGGRHLTAMKIQRKYKMENMPDMLSMYYGYGAHIGYVKWNESVNDSKHGYYWEQKSGLVLGLDAIVGISYDLIQYPLSFTFDVKPFFDLLGADGFKFKPYDFAFGAVYYF